MTIRLDVEQLTRRSIGDRMVILAAAEREVAQAEAVVDERCNAANRSVIKAWIRKRRRRIAEVECLFRPA